MSFLKSYKRLDNLCKNLFSSEKGVTTYIESMERMTRPDFQPENFNSDYKELKHYRYIRNQLVHDNDADEADMCDENDMLWIEGFHRRIIEQTDPISQYRKAQTESRRQAAKSKKAQQPVKPKASNKPKIAFAVFYIVFIIILAAFLIMLLKNQV